MLATKARIPRLLRARAMLAKLPILLPLEQRARREAACRDCSAAAPSANKLGWKCGYYGCGATFERDFITEGVACALGRWDLLQLAQNHAGGSLGT